MTYLGSHEGQCFPWVRRVIAEATGVSMGFGYHAGYIEGGATEVPLSEARRGDVIQIADPNNNGPGVNYAGLHTVIVVTRNNDGTFDVVDSNSKWDGIVRSRSGYDPVASAARFPNVTARAYRFSHVEPGTQFAVDGARGAWAPSDAPLVAGEQARIATDTGGCLNLRETAGTDGAILTCLANGQFVTVLDGTAEGGGYTWRQVSVGGQVGWVADIYLTAVGGDPTASTADTTAASEEATDDLVDEPADEIQAEEMSSGIGQIVSGGLPATGGVALLVWGGGGVDALHTIATNGGCNLLSVWSTADGDLVGHIVGAPAFVNATWEEHFPGEMPADTPLLAVCARPDAEGLDGPTSPPDGEFIEGDGPPGPAGNES